MFFDISAKSQVNTFSINENYAGLVLASDINRLSCSTDKNSMNDNIFSNNSGNIYNSGSVRNYVDSFKTVIGDFNLSKIIFFIPVSSFFIPCECDIIIMSFLSAKNLLKLFFIKNKIKSHWIKYHCFRLIDQNFRKFVKWNFCQAKFFTFCKFFKFHNIRKYRL